MRRILLLLIVVSLSFAPIPFPREPINREQSGPVRFTAELEGRIRQGMTEQNVIAILGKPAGDYCTATAYLASPDCYRSNVWLTPKGMKRSDGITEKAWSSNIGGIAVEFDSNGLVIRSYWEAHFVD